ncbi:hypothetical protein CERSUDRAFT_118057 [Gelatoporia subvermispora B]|uniref:Steroid 5-alpha reductase C-terminal domain-containing protein n=1 Tax=Ceriporiopsis subvermispora (strain B) TaxID=914234 RepID=M2PCP4_CERS8|nr:hypothetical protein CERSUDRAFT_118057 [Gelatoporia subvermispora B]
MAPVPVYGLLRGIFRWPVKICVWTTLTSYALSVITSNCSQVDRIWTFMPTIYTAYYALLPLWPKESFLPLWPYTPDTVDPAFTQKYSPRALLMFALVTTWMFRLSYNTWRRGLFAFHDEDYRWAIFRKQVPRWFFEIFNFTFIALIQNIILFLLGLPTHIAALQQPERLSTSDYILGTSALVIIALEFISDNQQYSYQSFKHDGVDPNTQWPGAKINWTQRDVQRGFCTRGLWAWSRHPNFLCEQTFWIIINLMPLVAPESPKYDLPPTSMTPIWPLAPAVVLCTLFFSSTIFTESISLSKYPEAYKAYQSRVAMFVPFLTPVWGLWLKLWGKKEEVDEIVYGQSLVERTKRD